MLWIRARQILSDSVRAIRISILEIQSEYQGTIIGIYWIPISALIFSAMLALVFHHNDDESLLNFFLYVFAGYTLWSFISRSINDGTALIQKKFEFAIHSGLDLRGLFSKALVERLCEYGLNLITLVVIAGLLQPEFFSPRLILFVPFLLMAAAASLSVSYLVNLSTVLVPDMANVIRTGVRFLFFVSPVFWSAGNAGVGDLRQILRTYNPVSYFLELPRQASGITALRMEDWLVAAAITACISALGAAAFAWSHSFVRNIR